MWKYKWQLRIMRCFCFERVVVRNEQRARFIFYSRFFFIACIGFDTKQLIRSKSSTGNDFFTLFNHICIFFLLQNKTQQLQIHQTKRINFMTNHGYRRSFVAPCKEYVNAKRNVSQTLYKLKLNWHPSCKTLTYIFFFHEWNETNETPNKSDTTIHWVTHNRYLLSVKRQMRKTSFPLNIELSHFCSEIHFRSRFFFASFME